MLFAHFYLNFRGEIREKCVFNSPMQPNTHWLMQYSEICNSSILLGMDILNDAIICKSGEMEVGLNLLVMTVGCCDRKFTFLESCQLWNT